MQHLHVLVEDHWLDPRRTRYVRDFVVAEPEAAARELEREQRAGRPGKIQVCDLGCLGRSWSPPKSSSA